MANKVRDLLKEFGRKKTGSVEEIAYLRDLMTQFSGWKFYNIAGVFNGHSVLAAGMFYSNIDNTASPDQDVIRMTQAIIRKSLPEFEFFNPTLLPVIDNRPVIREISFGWKAQTVVATPKDKTLKEMLGKIVNDGMAPKDVDLEKDLIVYVSKVEIGGNSNALGAPTPEDIEINMCAVLKNQ